MEEEYFVISLLSDNGEKIGINIPAQSTTLILSASFNIIEEAFQGLRGLYSSSPQRVTVTNLLNKLLSSTSSDYQLCASVFPLGCLEQICAQCLTLDALRVFVEACCVLYPEISCFEIDVDGNQYPLKRFVTQTQGQSSGGSGRLQNNPSLDKQLVKDVTDALRNKLLELRQSQEQGNDSYEIEASLVAIWQNAKILWHIETYGDNAAAELSRRWSGILQWSKRTHKKQVKADAKLVLATRICLEEQGHCLSQKTLHVNGHAQHNQKDISVSPLVLFSSMNSLEFWCITFLSEYCGARNIAQDYLLPQIHRLLCPVECIAGVGSSKASLPYPLNDLNTFSKRDSMDISKNLRVHLHRYSVDTCPQEVATYVHVSSSPPLTNIKHTSHSEWHRPPLPVTPPTPTTSTPCNYNTREFQSSIQSYFDDDDNDDENHVQSNTKYISSNIKHTNTKGGSSSESHRRTDTSQHQHFLSVPAKNPSPTPVSTPRRSRQHVSQQQQTHSQPTPTRTRSQSPKRLLNNIVKEHRGGVGSMVTHEEVQLYSSRTQSEKKNYYSNGDISHIQENPNDVSTVTHNSVVEARSPPRRQPHPYPRYTHQPPTGGRGGDGRGGAFGLTSSGQQMDDETWYRESALDYLNPLNDTKLSLNELEDSYHLGTEIDTDTHISASKRANLDTKNHKASDNSAIYHRSQPQYNLPARTTHSSAKNDTKTKTQQNEEVKKSPPKELYDRNGHRIKTHSSTTTGQRVRRKSFSMGETLSSSFSRGAGGGKGKGSKDDSVAFGRRLTHSERPLPVPSQLEKGSALSKSTESIIDKDPEYAQARALYRLRHVRRQEADSKNEAALEEKLRIERLRALELKADMCRLRHSQTKRLKTQQAQKQDRAQLSQSLPNRGRSRSIESANRRPRASSTGRSRPHFDFEAEEGRRRAAVRIRQKRQEMREKELLARQREYQKKQERWDMRDEKINAFLERQLMKENANSNSSSPHPITRALSHSSNNSNNGSSFQQNTRSPHNSKVLPKEVTVARNIDTSQHPISHPPRSQHLQGGTPPPGSLKINWSDVGREDEHVDTARREAEEISFMIDHALGVSAGHDGRIDAGIHEWAINDHDYENLRDAHSSSTPTSYRPQRLQREQQQQQQDRQHPPSVPYSPTTAAQDMLCIKVFRAYGLPELLGGTHPYVLFDWGHLGRASTHAIQSTTAPEFNATLRFKSPSAHGSAQGTALMSAPPLGISVYSRNDSMSDTVIGGIQLDDKDLNSNYPLRVYLYTSDKEQVECGVLEFQVFVI